MNLLTQTFDRKYVNIYGTFGGEKKQIDMTNYLKEYSILGNTVQNILNQIYKDQDIIIY